MSKADSDFGRSILSWKFLDRPLVTGKFTHALLDLIGNGPKFSDDIAMCDSVCPSVKKQGTSGTQIKIYKCYV